MSCGKRLLIPLWSASRQIRVDIGQASRCVFGRTFVIQIRTSCIMKHSPSCRKIGAYHAFDSMIK